MESDAPDAAGTAPVRDERTTERPAKRDLEPLQTVIERVLAKMTKVRSE